MSDIVERLRLLVPSDSSGASIEAAEAINALRAENERLRIELLTIAGHPELHGTKGADIARAALSQPAHLTPEQQEAMHGALRRSVEKVTQPAPAWHGLIYDESGSLTASVKPEKGGE